VYNEDYDWDSPGTAEISRHCPRDNISTEDCSCVAKVAKGLSPGHSRHLAMASTGHGVFKGVLKHRKTPKEKKKNESGADDHAVVVGRKALLVGEVATR
jgi:hypothetical protein